MQLHYIQMYLSQAQIMGAPTDVAASTIHGQKHEPLA